MGKLASDSAPLFNAPSPDLKLANRDQRIVEAIGQDGWMSPWP